jgi:hypothetical protein
VEKEPSQATVSWGFSHLGLLERKRWATLLALGTGRKEEVVGEHGWKSIRPVSRG